MASSQKMAFFIVTAAEPQILQKKRVISYIYIPTKEEFSLSLNAADSRNNMETSGTPHA
jgi:hypothetical protein